MGQADSNFSFIGLSLNFLIVKHETRSLWLRGRYHQHGALTDNRPPPVWPPFPALHRLGTPINSRIYPQPPRLLPQVDRQQSQCKHPLLLLLRPLGLSEGWVGRRQSLHQAQIQSISGGQGNSASQRAEDIRGAYSPCWALEEHRRVLEEITLLVNHAY